MRQQNVFGVTRKAAVAAMPWACKIVKVDGGYRGFETIAGYRVWRLQK